MLAFEILRDTSGKFYFRLVAADGRIIARGEKYDTKEELIEAIELFKDAVPEAKTIDKTLEDIQRDVKTIKEGQFKQEKQSHLSFYFGVLLGGLLGVVGNFFVSFWFEKPSHERLLGLVVSGIFLLILFVILLLQARKYGR